MSPQVVGPQMDPNDLPYLVHNSPTCGVGNRKDPLIGPNTSGNNVLSETVGHLLRDKNSLMILTTLGAPEG